MRALVKTQAALKADPERAADGRAQIVPGPSAAALIAELVRRDLPYYDAAISRDFVAGMNAFARDLGIPRGEVPYETVVAAQLVGGAGL